ncbi:hypothetical protein JQC91_14350 [Jannaschia sp. Os4]|uniref:hypothetical protein n=1 Tax=Jannaschia sp. Os4 TaxID=2807617 RepID=UPI001939B28B|nr:hypothetical protein [Jannaschia sp. Os4]MBM2577485.1 hypothetical protein [Jannaschia sp. Os4]
MTPFTIPAALGALLLAAVAIGLATGRLPRGSWAVPAVLSAGFLGVSLLAVADGGPLGFWTVHTGTLWGLQVWLDLLICAGVALFAWVPRARAAGVAPAPWVAATLATGGIGLLAFVAAVIRAERRAGRPSPMPA